MTTSLADTPAAPIDSRQADARGARLTRRVSSRLRARLRGVRRQWYWMTPLVAIVLFMVMMGGIVWWLYDQDQQSRHDSLQRDVESTQQTVRIKLLSNQDSLLALARGVGSRDIDEAAFRQQAREIIDAHPEMVAVSFVDENRISRWVARTPALAGGGFRAENDALREAESYWAFDLAHDDRRLTYTRPFLAPNSDVFFEVHLPVMRGARFAGVVIGTYSLGNSVQHLVSPEIRRKYLITVVDEGGNQLAASSSRSTIESTMSETVVVDPPGYGMYLRAYGYRSRPQFAENLLFWLVAALSIAIVWSLFALWRHMRRRAIAEQAVVQETSFRRAMENSMSTGMRAIDMTGRISYVNTAFCRMTGFEEHDFIGVAPPYPYWNPGNFDEHQRQMEMVLGGRVPRTGLETTMYRRDGTHFSARLYVTPLIDERSVQTGWMTSITDITEPRRVRENLAAAHHRFTTVLESLEAAVSVFAPDEGQTGELLFANRYYRQLFGHGTEGHIELSGGPQTLPENNAAHERYASGPSKWFEVRTRRIEWVDGRKVYMQIATDITDRKQAEEMSRQQQEKVALTSRLITMGEMASSLAHELNQPLTAITNYAMGTVARIKSHQARGEAAEPAELLPALEKTSAQAERAGAIIRRIREFVKRSEPDRKETDIRLVLEDALGLVEFDATRRGLAIQVDFEPDLPTIEIDRILIEQVLINLIRNGLEAMSGMPAAAPRSQRALKVSVGLVPGYMAIDVIDHGTGIPDDVLDRLFEPFYSTKAEGMGMGLNICRTIIEFHQGRLWAENNLDDHRQRNGCTFHVRLPLNRSTSNPLVATAARA